ncbi:SDR family NAD(P)-dependent oxidoreductase, partial [Neoroseomonas rubea]|uniref:SDR family NAD(P)-dependent oxidoreductase n=1 Tax=Neoroseomonas rubea TaxID=2748666 RepID=UPI0018DFF463
MGLDSTAFRLDGRRILVTGASLGIGRAIACAAAGAGATVVIAARGRDGLIALAAEIAAAGGVAEPLPFDAA